MKKIKSIIVLIFLIILMFSNNIYAKYKYNFEKVIHITRDNTPPDFNISYSKTDWTNEDILVTVSFDEEVEILENNEWTISENSKTFTKILNENKKGILKVEDISENILEIPYEVSNIDKELPQITGIQNGEIYYSDIELIYTDNSGIASVVIDKYNYMDFSYTVNYSDTENPYAKDINIMCLKVNITEKPEKAKSYKYYLNENLYEITENTEYGFLDVQSGQIYNLRIEAVDEDLNVIETVIKDIIIEEGLIAKGTDVYNEDNIVSEVYGKENISNIKNDDVNNKLTENGQYKITVTDLAGNIAEYNITIAKAELDGFEKTL